jgi:hypothetical protein
MSDIQRQINARIEAFVSEVSALARQAAMEALSSALDHTGARRTGGRAAAPSVSNGVALTRTPRRKGAKRSPDEIAGTVTALQAHIAANPGQRMEEIASALNVGTKDLTLPIKKLLADKSISRRGQKRATRYYPGAGAGAGAGAAAKRGAAKSAGAGARKGRRGAKRRTAKKKA